MRPKLGGLGAVVAVRLCGLRTPPPPLWFAVSQMQMQPHPAWACAFANPNPWRCLPCLYKGNGPCFGLYRH